MTCYSGVLKIQLPACLATFPAFIFMSACAPHPVSVYPQSPPPTYSVDSSRPPCSENYTRIKSVVSHTFYMGDYKVTADRPSGDLQPISMLWANGFYVQDDKVFGRMEFNYPGKCSSDKRFYLVEIPNKKFGQFTHEARLINDTIGYRRLEDALSEIHVRVTVVRGALVDPVIKNNNEGTVGLYVDHYGVFKGDPVAVIQSRVPSFFNFRWLVVLPLVDGSYTLVAARHDSSIDKQVRRVTLR